MHNFKLHYRRGCYKFPWLSSLPGAPLRYLIPSRRSRLHYRPIYETYQKTRIRHCVPGVDRPHQRIPKQQLSASRCRAQEEAKAWKQDPQAWEQPGQQRRRDPNDEDADKLRNFLLLFPFLLFWGVFFDRLGHALWKIAQPLEGANRRNNIPRHSSPRQLVPDGNWLCSARVFDAVCGMRWGLAFWVKPALAKVEANAQQATNSLANETFRPNGCIVPITKIDASKSLLLEVSSVRASSPPRSEPSTEPASPNPETLQEDPFLLPAPAPPMPQNTVAVFAFPGPLTQNGRRVRLG